VERYSHIRKEANRRGVDTLSRADFEPVVPQNWAQFFFSEKSDEAKLLKIAGEPGRTRTCNPLIKSARNSVLFVQRVPYFQRITFLVFNSFSPCFLGDYQI